MPGFLLAVLLSATASDSLLVSTDWLEKHRSDPNLIVVHLSMQRADYESGHVPGARFLDPMRLMDSRRPGVELPTVEQIGLVLQELGVTPISRVVYYGDTWMAPRVFLALEYVGLGDHAAVLDGGLPAWKAEGRSLVRDAPQWTPSTLHLTAHPDIVADADWIKGHLQDTALALVDGRSPGEYAATDSSERLPRFGHIPGAMNLPWDETFTNGAAALDGTMSRLRPAAELRKLFEAAGGRNGRALVTYCTVGLRASHLYFVARYLGLHPRIYDGSMSEWSRRPELPMVRGTAPR